MDAGEGEVPPLAEDGGEICPTVLSQLHTLFILTKRSPRLEIHIFHDLSNALLDDDSCGGHRKVVSATVVKTC